MKALLNNLMSWVGYVPRSKIDVGSLEFNISVNSASMDAAIEKLGHMQAAAVAAEKVIGGLDAALLPIVKQFAADFGADDTRSLLLAELRKQTTLLEVLAKQGDRAAKPVAISLWTDFDTGHPATGASASGLPG